MPVRAGRTQFSIGDDNTIIELVDRIAALCGCTRADIYKFATRQFLARTDQIDTAEHALLSPLRDFAERQRTRGRVAPPEPNSGAAE